MSDDKKEDKKQLVYNLELYKNKIVYVKFIGGREIIGKLLSYDSLQNIIVCNPEKDEVCWEYGKYVICIGSSIVSLSRGIPYKMPVEKQ